MFIDGGVPVSEAPEPPTQAYRPSAARALAEKVRVRCDRSHSLTWSCGFET